MHTWKMSALEGADIAVHLSWGWGHPDAVVWAQEGGTVWLWVQDEKPELPLIHQ